MSSTNFVNNSDYNVEESADAAFGLVALCDQTFQEVDPSHISEEIVETTEYISDEYSCDQQQDNIRVFLQNLKPEEYHQFQVEQGPSGETFLSVAHIGAQNETQYFVSTNGPKDGSELGETEIDLSSSHLHHAVVFRDESQDAAHHLVAEELTSNETDIDEDDKKDADQALAHIQDVGSAEGVVISYDGALFDEAFGQRIKCRQSIGREATEWKAYARGLLRKGYSTGFNFMEPEIVTSLKNAQDACSKFNILAHVTEKDCLQPAVQFWDFEKVFLAFGGDRKYVSCPSCNAPMIFVPIGTRFALRMLYDTDKPVLLVTSFLRCSGRSKKQHEILGYDPRLLRLFPNLDLPFMLFHKAGITKTMMEFILECVIGGMTVNRLYDVVKTKYEVNHTIRAQFFANEIDSVRSEMQDEGSSEFQLLAENFNFPVYISCHPSKALLGRCFLAAFKDKDDHYKYCMQQLQASECIILDDSLCMGARIGLPGIWGSATKLFPDEYQGMFLVFNEAKHVLTWTFLKNNDFSEVDKLLMELRDRHLNAGVSLKACFTSKCCEWRDNLREIFGRWFIVKGNLRLFLDAIIKELPSDHSYYKECISELTLVFRETADVNEIRNDYTADPVIIQHNLQEFVKRWRDVIDDRIQSVLSEKALELLQDLETHIQAGCLSNIPPEVGDDNFNDIHNALRKSVSHCRITVPLVSALFSMCLHEINRNKGAPVEFPYRPGNRKHLLDAEPIVDDGKSTVSVQTDVFASDDFKSSTPTLVEKQHVIAASEIIRIVHKFFSLWDKTDEPTERLIKQALMYYKYQEDFDAMAPKTIVNLRLLPYYSSALNLISHPAFPKEDFEMNTQIVVADLPRVISRIHRIKMESNVAYSKLKGSPSDLFIIIGRQLMKDRLNDHLSADVAEYSQFLETLGAVSFEETHLVLLLKRILDFQDSDDITAVKDQLMFGAAKSIANPDATMNRELSKIVVVSKTEHSRDTPTSTKHGETSGTDSITAAHIRMGDFEIVTVNERGESILMDASTLTGTIKTAIETAVRREIENQNRTGKLAIEPTVFLNAIDEKEEKDSIDEKQDQKELHTSNMEDQTNFVDTEVVSRASNQVSATEEPLTEVESARNVHDFCMEQSDEPSMYQAGVKTKNDTLPLDDRLATLDGNLHVPDVSAIPSKSSDLIIEMEEERPKDFEMLKNMADTLGAIITVFTNLEHCWVVPVFPETYNLFSANVFIAYSHQRFFGVCLANKANVLSVRNINLKRQGKDPLCRCGRGTKSKDNGGKCVAKINGKYTTRCVCFRLDRPCTDLCDCKGCENPFGVRPERVRQKYKLKIPYRQRYAHDAAKIATCKSSSISMTTATQTTFLADSVTVEAEMENWVALEHCIFEALINEIKSDESIITPAEVQETFNTVVRMLSSMAGLEKVAYTKTIEEISMKLQQREKDVSEYLRTYQQQVDLSLG